MAQEPHLSPSATARLLGVSPKALRLYESRGLVAPIRSHSGWRAYGATEIARLHQILALKRLGLPLAQIAELLSRRVVALEKILSAQEQALAREQVRVSRALGLVRDARAKLAGGGALSVDDLIQLTRETTMTNQERDEAMKTVFDPLIDKHFSEAEHAELAARPYDQTEASRAWERLIAEAKILAAKGDPASEEAKDLARRWMAQMRLFTQGDAKIAAKVSAVWNDALADAAAAPKLPLSPEIFAFVRRASAEAG